MGIRLVLVKKPAHALHEEILSLSQDIVQMILIMWDVVWLEQVVMHMEEMGSAEVLKHVIFWEEQMCRDSVRVPGISDAAWTRNEVMA